MIVELAGWGRYPRVPCRVTRPREASEIRLGPAPVIARGMGRAYGDSALNPSGVIDMTAMNRMLDFDAETGHLTAEAGVTLAEVIAAFLPRGWFPVVTPGTKHVSLGGAIAADVHGKNHHHAGSFGDHVDWLDLLGPDGNVVRCSQTQNPELFAFTRGGMGLTGIILRAAFRLQRVESGWIRQEIRPLANLGDALEAFEATDAWPYSVAWIDCLARGDRLGRALLMLGEHAPADALEAPARANPFRMPARRSLRVPLDAPGWTLNRHSVGAFNALYHRRGLGAAGTTLIDWDRYFYPLDALRDWTRIYGARGFVQFQCVIPPPAARAGLGAILEAVSEAGEGSFLAVLKCFGAQESAISFPMAGYTLALDFPVRLRTLALLDRLDAITLDHGGRFYLAKDARLRAETHFAADPRAESLREIRAQSGARERFASLQSTRLAL